MGQRYRPLLFICLSKALWLCQKNSSTNWYQKWRRWKKMKQPSLTLKRKSWKEHISAVCFLKWWNYSNTKSMSSFTHPYVIPNLNELKRRYFVQCLNHFLLLFFVHAVLISLTKTNKSCFRVFKINYLKIVWKIKNYDLRISNYYF